MPPKRTPALASKKTKHDALTSLMATAISLPGLMAKVADITRALGLLLTPEATRETLSNPLTMKRKVETLTASLRSHHSQLEIALSDAYPRVNKMSTSSATLSAAFEADKLEVAALTKKHAAQSNPSGQRDSSELLTRKEKNAQKAEEYALARSRRKAAKQVARDRHHARLQQDKESADRKTATHASYMLACHARHNAKIEARAQPVTKSKKPKKLPSQVAAEKKRLAAQILNLDKEIRRLKAFHRRNAPAKAAPSYNIVWTANHGRLPRSNMFNSPAIQAQPQISATTVNNWTLVTRKPRRHSKKKILFGKLVSTQVEAPPPPDAALRASV